ncbi:universal stress protein [Corynebacterium qintianiae]|uniref:universal stress protein n=1 Tax=Corynebacterium qintianiae TaxID=2709392 RepID=UPI0013EC536D|nr:universal stress protein [Corynebacterium qintianiae]
MSRARIMVSYIATGGGIDALRLAVAIAKERDMAIDIVMAMVGSDVTPGMYPKIRGHETIVEKQIGGWLDDARAEVPEGIEVTTSVAVGDSVAEIIIAQARQLGSELITVGSQGGGIFRRVSLGSVVNTLLHSCPVPLAIAPRGYNHPGAVDRATVMFGTRPGATDIIEFGIDGAKRHRFPVRFVSLNINGERPSSVDALGAVEHTAGPALAGQVRELIHDSQATAEVVEASSIDAAVAQLDWKPGEIACLGSSRIAAEGRLFVGATATQIIRHIPVPTVVIPNGYSNTRT